MAADVSKFHFRLVLLGSLGTGFLFKKFETKYKPTVEDLFSKTFDLGSIELKVDFLDTAGSMQFPAMRRLSITTGSAFLIVYSVDDETSFEVLKMCISEIQEIRPDFQEIPIVFAGNKCDIPRERRKVLKEVVSNYVHYELPARLRAKVIECSCRDSINIDNLFKAYLSLARVTLSSGMGPTQAGAEAGVKSSSGSTGNIRNQMKAQRTSSNSLVTPSKDQHHSSNDSLYLLRPSSTNNNNNNNNNSSTNGRCSSIKDALGVRKSCDASILAARKSTHGFPCVTTTPPPPPPLNPANYGRLSATDYSSSTGSKQELQEQYQEVMNLERAIQSKLSVSQPAKPRSRSLIWRPHTRKSRSSANDGSDCRIT